MQQLYNLQQYGSLSIVTVPDRVNIYIDGIEQKDINGNPILTPAFISNISIGHHTYKLTSPRYVDVEGIILVEDPITYNLFIIMKSSLDEIKDILLFSFIASLAAGVTLFLLTRDRIRSFG